MTTDRSEISKYEIAMSALRGAAISIFLIFPILFYWFFPLKKLHYRKRKILLIYTLIYTFIFFKIDLREFSEYYTSEIKAQPAIGDNSSYITAKKLMTGVYINGALIQHSYENKEISVDGVIKRIDIEESCRGMDCNNSGIAVQLNAIPIYNMEHKIVNGSIISYFDISEEIRFSGLREGDRVVVKCNEISVLAPGIVNLNKCHSILKF